MTTHHRKAVIVYGGLPAHEPELCAGMAAEMLQRENFEVLLSDSLDCFRDLDRLKSFDLIIPCWSLGEIDKEQCSNLVEAVRSGSGLAGWHGGMCDAFRTKTEYQFMAGGQWVAHPGNIRPYTVQISQPEDPVVAGIGEFSLLSEQYYMHVDPRVNVLATTTFHTPELPCIDGVVMPVMWKTTWGEGRVFYTSLGHNSKTFTEVPEAKETLRRGMLWASR